MMIWPYLYHVKVHKEFRRKLYTIFLDFGILLNPCAYNRSNKPLNRKTNNKGVLYMQFTKNSYEKMSELSAIPQQSLLAIGVPDIKFYQTSRGLQALCPFHNDHKLGSFIFNPTTGVWKCFSCGVGGSGAISFIMKVNNWDFLKAVGLFI